MASQDLLVDLYAVDYSKKECDVTIKRVLSPDSDLVLKFIGENFSAGWVSEAKAALYQAHPTCFIAIENKEVIGFACYDATGKGMFGPTGVSKEHQGKGIGRALLLHCLEGMMHDGYAYGIIGAVSEQVQPFYQKSCGSIPIQNSKKIYNRLTRY